MIRRLVDGSQVSDKWLFADLETGDVWVWSIPEGCYRRATPERLAALGCLLEYQSLRN